MSGCSSCPSHGGCASESAGGCGTQAGTYVPTFVPLRLGNRILTVVAVGSGKGGVGKSTVTALLAVALRRAGYRVGILDADITGPSMAQAFGLEGGLRVNEEEHWEVPHTSLGMPLISLNLLLEDKGDPVVWRGPVIGSVIKQFWTEVEWGELDVLLLDMPPGTGDVPLTVFQSIPVDRFVLVSTPQDLVHMIVAKASRMANRMQVPVLGFIQNLSWMACGQCGTRVYPFGETRGEAVAEKLGLAFLDELPIDASLPAHMDDGSIEKVETVLLPHTVEAIAALIERKKKILQAGAED